MIREEMEALSVMLEGSDEEVSPWRTQTIIAPTAALSHGSISAKGGSPGYARRATKFGTGSQAGRSGEG